MNRLLLIAFLLFLPLQVAQAQEALQRAADNTGSCDPKVEGVCYHLFDSTESAATSADSTVYEVKGCDSMSYKLDGDGGTATLFVKECSVLSSGACNSTYTTVFTADVDGDGLITSVDEATVLDGTVGKRGYKHLVPAARWHYIDVQAVPGSGTVYVTVTCHR